MGQEAMIALVLIITQVVKEKLREWFPSFKIEKFISVLLALVVSAGVVVYNYLFKLHIPIDLNILVVILTVWVMATFGKKFAKSLFQPKPKIA